MKILFIGDIVGQTGRDILKTQLKSIKKNNKIDFVIANGENSAHGSGITEKILREIIDSGVDVITSGNHIFKKKEAIDLVNKKENHLIIPANYPEKIKANRTIEKVIDGQKVVVINLMGRVFMKEGLDCPFQKIDNLLTKISYNAIIVVDFHGEVTSEKRAFGFYTDGKVTAVIGSHTHVQTSDSEILPKGTAYITDAGMTGSVNSILGDKKESIINSFLTGLPFKLEPEDHPAKLEGVIIDIDDNTLKAENIETIRVFE
ncbi:TIGR00282 family metallophosphoesterase [Candidatus Berkelbacteria bacterium CG_4_10_14_0_8_um_filter_35_9_33_8]|uniref:TIGR00282 family metallophosphoesterase n=1 Tax=Candidatus Berkelbacteria bacterium CG_4_10_14_0_2_um_filter_35_9_33_12 TaxID=1974499 RepID=A0A2M7W3L0_9BACT|nr:MAG: TIGR00282 family metallophosphoesterase [Candidatus Berkelbacteria bacterium CG23_combo_of_CG06-09_8_20_14_all_33_15]PIS08624.1 MAG: TIGR00282 family metallophosphoesterase [Candidatus Berkelbacteria bacterium CG10_big_fil_rev_8_21_14_0_10_33_10]PIZ28095.1 MAG: TIGR00282 family metallophosphoesterase [Candidatus Berkelbacteria bacterium CG_4_10_14_0_8_um_filter_35_9_33_8]PJA20077.1 MAG: TIGR00282 family metallophosphoesterase [Candidatus Berkelbacteria bacterium CG_4_10_14_0_2_um_filter_